MLTNPLFANNPRFVRAAENAPPMRRGESNQEAVRILQNAMIGVGVSTMRRSIRRDGTLDGDFGTETVEAVKRFQRKVGQLGDSGHPDGIVGRETMRELDSAAPRHLVPVTVAQTPAPIPRAESTGTTTTARIRLPTGEAMLREYRRFRASQGRPCGQGISNQCAVRMSVALMRSDIDFFFDRSRIEHMHSATNRHCRGTGVAHNTSASRLFNYLRGFWHFEQFRRGGPHGIPPERIMRQVSTRHGIIYFEQCFDGGPGVGGDHIDYWDGRMTMNDRMNYNGPGEQPANDSSTLRWFRNTRRDIYFLAIPAS